LHVPPNCPFPPFIRRPSILPSKCGSHLFPPPTYLHWPCATAVAQIVDSAASICLSTASRPSHPAPRTQPHPPSPPPPPLPRRGAGADVEVPCSGAGFEGKDGDGQCRPSPAPSASARVAMPRTSTARAGQGTQDGEWPPSCPSAADSASHPAPLLGLFFGRRSDGPGGKQEVTDRPSNRS
jgi:hypothetical protein